jgi:hypothetical protein
MSDDGIVYLTVDFTAAAGTQTTATIERGTSAAGPWTLLDTVELLGQVGVYNDTTAPLDTPLWYRWTGSPNSPVQIQGPFTEVSVGTVLLKDPLRPWANVEAMFCSSQQQVLEASCGTTGPEIIWAGLDNKVYQADANLFDVYNARVPADVYGTRKRLDSGMRVLTRTLAAKDAVEALFAGGGPLQLQLPDEYGLPDMIVQPGDLTEAYIWDDQRRPIRLWSAPFTTVDRPLGPQQGTEFGNWCAVAEAFDTFADLTASGATWAQIASGEAVGGEPVLDGYGEGGYGEGPYGD